MSCGLIFINQSNVTIAPESFLAKFIEQAIPRTPLGRAKLLEETELFATIHSSAAHAGQSEVPENLDTNLHFCAFVQAPSPIDGKLRLLELDGRRAGPVDRGPSCDLLTVRHLIIFLALVLFPWLTVYRMLPSTSEKITWKTRLA